MVTINGSAVHAAGKTVQQYLKENNYSLTRVAVELNGEIVPKTNYAETVLKDGDTVEVVGFVGGG